MSKEDNGKNSSVRDQIAVNTTDIRWIKDHMKEQRNLQRLILGTVFVNIIGNFLGII